ncbi:MAG: transglycosylase SLT domain-containing protein, partial [Umezawaea sp.]
MVDGWGDGAGYHLQVARERSGFTWQEVAVLRPAGLDDESWSGYQCVSGDGRFAAVAVLPRTVVNTAAARDHGAFAYSVDLVSGAVKPLARGVGLKYHTPGCGTGATAVFSLNPGVDQQSTRLLVADLASGVVTDGGLVTGQLTSAVPTEQGVVGVAGSSVVAVTDGKLTKLSDVDGSAYDLRPAADGGLDYLAVRQGKGDAAAFHLRNGAARRTGTGEAAKLHLFQGRAGHTVIGGARDVPADSGLVRADVSGFTGSASLDGHALLGVGGDPEHPQPAVAATRTGKVFQRPRASTASAGLSTGVGATAPGLQPDTSTPPVALGKPHPKTDAAPTAAQNRAQDTAQTPTCSVPRLDPARQVPQPSAKQVEWAVQMAQQGLLTGSAYTRPAGFDNLGLAAYAPSDNFPKIPLQHPTGDSWDSVPRSVMQAIMAQESNWSQASWHSLPGMTGGPLVADYYGAAGDIVSINYPGADCGYGLAQVTTGMRAGDGSVYSPNGQKKVAVDYQENIAAGLQILEDTWNRLYDMGTTANGGNPRYLENWYFAIWAYNSGVQPNAANGNTTGCTPGPACTGPHGTWGLGWTNNPANLDYPPTRTPFLQASYDDAKHPSSWPYQERVLGWMASPILRFGSHAFATPDYHGGKTWVQPAPFTAFCASDNHCDPNATNPTTPGASHCLLDDFQCWWHQ